jgi:hypothetical protein
LDHPVLKQEFLQLNTSECETIFILIRSNLKSTLISLRCVDIARRSLGQVQEILLVSNDNTESGAGFCCDLIY